MHKHTPTPWEAGKKYDDETYHPGNIYAGEELVARVSGFPDNVILEKLVGPEYETAIANARHIVHCVNTHDQLVEALEKVRAYAWDIGGGGRYDVCVIADAAPRHRPQGILKCNTSSSLCRKWAGL